jgi:pyridoxamine 5'-phosphate oxidase
MTPIDLFRIRYQEQLKLSKAKLLSACSFSTIGTDGFPNTRFVSLKEIETNAFIVTGTVSSRKGTEIDQNNKVALTFWWTESGVQVRIQGTAIRLPDAQLDRLFSERTRQPDRFGSEPAGRGDQGPQNTGSRLRCL